MSVSLPSDCVVESDHTEVFDPATSYLSAQDSTQGKAGFLEEELNPIITADKMVDTILILQQEVGGALDVALQLWNLTASVRVWSMCTLLGLTTQLLKGFKESLSFLMTNTSLALFLTIAVLIARLPEQKALDQEQPTLCDCWFQCRIQGNPNDKVL